VAIAYRDVGAMNFGTTSLVLTIPSTALTGDVLVAVIGDRATAGSTANPTGWTRQGGAANSNGRIQTFLAVVGVGGVAASGTVTFTSQTTACIGVIAVYSGVDTTNPADNGSYRSNASGTTGAGGPIANFAGSYAVLVNVAYANGSTWSAQGCVTNPTSGNVTERIDSANGTTMSVSLADGAKTNGTGSTGAVSATMGTAGANGSGIVLLHVATSPPIFHFHRDGQFEPHYVVNF